MKEEPRDAGEELKKTSRPFSQSVLDGSVYLLQAQILWQKKNERKTDSPHFLTAQVACLKQREVAVVVIYHKSKLHYPSNGQIIKDKVVQVIFLRA